LLRAALARAPADARLLHRMSVLRRQQGDLDGSLDLIRLAAAQQPKSPDILNSYGASLQAVGRHTEAAARFRRAIGLRPDYADAYNNLGNSLAALGRLDDAVAAFGEALTRNPDFAAAHNNLGKLLMDREDYDGAVAAYGRAVALDPGLTAAHNNRGNALFALNRHDEALESFRRANALAPDLAEVLWNESQVLLALEDYAEGWRKYEYRRSIPGLGTTPPDRSSTEWQGETDISGKTIFLRAEQGLGDTLLFARFAPAVAALGAEVVLEVQAPLTPLLRANPELGLVVAQGEKLPVFDLQAPMPSLPLALGSTAPIPAPYLRPAADRIGKWRALLGKGVHPRIGLAWAGNPINRYDSLRSIPLSALRPLFATKGVEMIALQTELRPGDAEILKAHGIRWLGDELHDFADTAAVISELDLLITVDTSIAHLAGALGKPVWVLLRFSPHFCWLVGREDSPWYPSARLIRQPAPGDWQSVVEAACQQLERWSAS
jgi:tetratricopeptide (TPR) repeat protein